MVNFYASVGGIENLLEGKEMYMLKYSAYRSEKAVLNVIGKVSVENKHTHTHTHTHTH
jgi:hypothetical protein